MFYRLTNISADPSQMSPWWIIEPKSWIHCWSDAPSGNDFSILPVMQYMKQVQTVLRSHNSRSDAVYETSTNSIKIYIVKYCILNHI